MGSERGGGFVVGYYADSDERSAGRDRDRATHVFVSDVGDRLRPVCGTSIGSGLVFQRCADGVRPEFLTCRRCRASLGLDVREEETAEDANVAAEETLEESGEDTPRFVTGHYVTPGRRSVRRSQTHVAVAGYTEIPVCGESPGPDAEFQWRADGVQVGFLTCRRCRRMSFALDEEGSEDAGPGEENPADPDAVLEPLLREVAATAVDELFSRLRREGAGDVANRLVGSFDEIVEEVSARVLGGAEGDPYSSVSVIRGKLSR